MKVDLDVLIFELKLLEEDDPFTVRTIIGFYYKDTIPKCLWLAPCEIVMHSYNDNSFFYGINYDLHDIGVLL